MSSSWMAPAIRMAIPHRRAVRISLRVLMCRDSIDFDGLTPSMTGQCSLWTSVKRILPCVFVVILLAAACGNDPTTENSASVPDAETALADDADGGETPESDDTGSDAANSETDGGGSAAPAEDEAVADEDSGVDWPLTFAGETVDGSAFEAGDYAGQDLVLWFWAPW